jgi:hypothetical protein
VTPPPFINKSGHTTIPFLSKTSSPANVVGPLAPSTTALHYNLSAFPLLIDFSTAAGTRKSHFFSMNVLGFLISVSSAPG